MKREYIGWIAGLMLLSSAAMAQPQKATLAELSTHGMFNDCTASVNFSNNRGPFNADIAQRVGHCSGYLMGLADGMDLSMNVFRKHSLSVRRYTADAFAWAFVNYLNANPEKIDAPHLNLTVIESWRAAGMLYVEKM